MVSILTRFVLYTLVNTSQVKKMIIEMYDATVKRFHASMQKMVRIADVPIGYVNADLWTSKVSGYKYLGELWLVHGSSQGWSLLSDARQSSSTENVL